MVAEYFTHLFQEIGVDPAEVDAVIGTPVRVNRAHREALREACNLVGLEQVRFVYEPTAALVGALYESAMPIDATILVVDWGGGTLDLAMVAIDKNLGFRELGVDGDVNDLGGSRMDQEIARRVLSHSQSAREAVEGATQGMAVLLETIERLKIEFLEEGIDAEARLVPGLATRVFLESALVHEVALDFAERARMAIRQMLAGMNMSSEDVTSVLFAGGVNQASVIRDDIMTLFPEATVLYGDNPQLETGIGCADLARRSFEVELAADFAVRQSDDSLCVLLPQGQAVALNAYRKAEFMVTDVLADEAVFDVGFSHFDPDRDSLWSMDGANFRSLGHIFLRVGQAELSRAERIPDYVQVFTGLDEYLNVAIFLRSQRTGASRQEYLTGVPLTIRVGDGDGR